MEGQEKTGFNYKEWYGKNKTRLSEKKAKRYQEDSAYREKAIQRSRQQRKSKTVDTDSQLIAFNEMAKALDISSWVLREWRRKSYFPEPLRRYNRLWFQPDQWHELHKLKTFFETHGTRVAQEHKPALEQLVAEIYANW